MKFKVGDIVKFKKDITHFEFFHNKRMKIKKIIIIDELVEVDYNFLESDNNHIHIGYLELDNRKEKIKRLINGK